MKIRFAEQKDIPELKNLWKVCFRDSDEYIDRFFESLYSAKNTVVTEIDSRVAGVTYMIPAKLGNVDFMYGYAIGVLPEFRGKSICEKMLNYINKLSKTKGFIFGLHPANEKLEHFYQKIGLKPMYTLKEIVLEDFSPYRECEILDISSSEIINMRKKSFSKLVEWEESIVDFIKLNGGYVKKITLQQKTAYFFARKESDALVVYETSADDELIKQLDPCIKKEFNVKNIKYILSSDTTLQGIEKPYVYGFSDINREVYMNLFLD